MKLEKFFSWLSTHLPHAVIIVCALVMISIGFYVCFESGPITAAVTSGITALKYVYAALLWVVGLFPIYALATRDVPLFLKASTVLMVLFAFSLMIRVAAVGFATSAWVYLLAFVIIVFLCRMVIWWSVR